MTTNTKPEAEVIPMKPATKAIKAANETTDDTPPTKTKAKTSKAKTKAKAPASKAKGTKANAGKHKAGPAKARAKSTEAAKPAAVTILARELGVSPKILRAKLRRRGLNAPYPPVAKLRNMLAGEDTK